MSRRAAWGLAVLVAVVALASALLLRPWEGRGFEVLEHVVEDLQSRYFEASLLEDGKETNVRVRYAPGGALEVDFSKSLYDMPRFFRIIEGRVYMTNHPKLGWIDLRTGEGRLYLAIFSLYDPRVLLSGLEDCKLERAGGTTLIRGAISERLLSSFDLPVKERQALENLFGGATVVVTLEGSTLREVEISSEGAGNITLIFEYPSEPAEIEAPSLVMVMESDSGMEELWEKESASMANADFLIAVLTSYKEKYGCYPEELNQSVAEAVGIEWPTNPFFDRPVENVTSPGDFGYVRVNCDDCFLQVYGWDGVVRIWFPPRG